MILRHWYMRVNAFVVQESGYNRTLVSASGLPEHSVGTTTTLEINYQWRRLISALIQPLLNENVYSGTETEVDTAIQHMHNLLNDLYD